MHGKQITFEQTITSMYGKDGQQWIQSLPTVVMQLTNKWHLQGMQHLPNLSYNYVLSGTKDSLPVILKLSFDTNAIAKEAQALRTLSGPCVNVLEYDSSNKALLLEAAIPGTTLKEYFPERDEESVIITSDLIKSFRSNQAAQTSFSTVADMLNILDKNYPALSHHLEHARELRTKLLSSTAPTVLLHGDLHHDNILRHGSAWRVIDPKGVIGDPAYECAAYIHNLFPELLAYPNINTLMNMRIQIFARQLGFSEQRIAQWSYVKAVMAACWAIDDNLDPRNWIALCDILKDLL